MRILDYTMDDGRTIYETPLMRVLIPEQTCGNVSMLVLLTQWLETESDCRNALRLLGTEAGLGHVSAFELILLLDRVDIAIERLYQVERITNPNISVRDFLRGFYSEFKRADIEARKDRSPESCQDVLSVWDVMPDLVGRLIREMKAARESSRIEPFSGGGIGGSNEN